jgi:hypothetical protein
MPAGSQKQTGRGSRPKHVLCGSESGDSSEARPAMAYRAERSSGQGKTDLLTPVRLFASGDLDTHAAEVGARGRGDFADKHLSYDGLGRD